jgi:hypothetical protein
VSEAPHNRLEWGNLIFFAAWNANLSIIYSHPKFCLPFLPPNHYSATYMQIKSLS